MATVHAQALAMMEKRRKHLRCNDFKHVVIVDHADGSYFVFQNAILERKKIGKFEMVLVFTEHCGYYAFYCDDLEGYHKCKPTK